jgi:hypothetical protein
MNEDLRIIFDLWHALYPTALGYCGCPWHCPRGQERALCLGCSYLITDPERLGVALSWRDSYATFLAYVFSAMTNRTAWCGQATVARSPRQAVAPVGMVRLPMA